MTGLAFVHLHTPWWYTMSFHTDLTHAYDCVPVLPGCESFEDLVGREGPITVDSGILQHAEVLGISNVDRVKLGSDVMVCATGVGGVVTPTEIRDRVNMVREVVSDRSFFFEGFEGFEERNDKSIYLIWGS